MLATRYKPNMIYYQTIHGELLFMLIASAVRVPVFLLQAKRFSPMRGIFYISDCKCGSFHARDNKLLQNPGPSLPLPVQQFDKCPQQLPRTLQRQVRTFVPTCVRELVN